MKRHKINKPVSKRGRGGMSTHSWKRRAGRRGRQHS